MENPAGESVDGPLRLDFDRRLKLEFHGSRITTDAGWLAYRELDDALGLTDMVGDGLVDPRTGKNGRHALTGLFRQSVFGRLGGYEDVNDADRLGRDALGCRRSRCCKAGRFHQPDGALRDGVSCRRREPCRTGRSVRAMDRPCA